MNHRNLRGPTPPEPLTWLMIWVIVAVIGVVGFAFLFYMSL